MKCNAATPHRWPRPPSPIIPNKPNIRDPKNRGKFKNRRVQPDSVLLRARESGGGRQQNEHGEGNPTDGQLDRGELGRNRVRGPVPKLPKTLQCDNIVPY